jgi:hypothetical protein
MPSGLQTFMSLTWLRRTMMLALDWSGGRVGRNSSGKSTVARRHAGVTLAVDAAAPRRRLHDFHRTSLSAREEEGCRLQPPTQADMEQQHLTAAGLLSGYDPGASSIRASIRTRWRSSSCCTPATRGRFASTSRSCRRRCRPSAWHLRGPTPPRPSGRPGSSTRRCCTIGWRISSSAACTSSCAIFSAPAGR